MRGCRCEIDGHGYLEAPTTSLQGAREAGDNMPGVRGSQAAPRAASPVGSTMGGALLDGSISALDELLDLGEINLSAISMPGHGGATAPAAASTSAGFAAPMAIDPSVGAAFGGGFIDFAAAPVGSCTRGRKRPNCDPTSALTAEAAVLIPRLLWAYSEEAGPQPMRDSCGVRGALPSARRGGATSPPPWAAIDACDALNRWKQRLLGDVASGVYWGGRATAARAHLAPSVDAFAAGNALRRPFDAVSAITSTGGGGSVGDGVGGGGGDRVGCGGGDGGGGGGRRRDAECDALPLALAVDVGPSDHGALTTRLTAQGGCAASDSPPTHMNGLALFMAPGSATGYVGVYQAGPATFTAYHHREFLGTFASATLAAAAYARRRGTTALARASRAAAGDGHAPGRGKTAEAANFSSSDDYGGSDDNLSSRNSALPAEPPVPSKRQRVAPQSLPLPQRKQEQRRPGVRRTVGPATAPPRAWRGVAQAEAAAEAEEEGCQSDASQQVGPSKCGLCHRVCGSRGGLGAHLKHCIRRAVKAAKAPWVCPRCSYSTGSRSGLSQHLITCARGLEVASSASRPRAADSLVESAPGPEECRFCQKAFATVQARRSHQSWCRFIWAAEHGKDNGTTPDEEGRAAESAFGSEEGGGGGDGGDLADSDCDGGDDSGDDGGCDGGIDDDDDVDGDEVQLLAEPAEDEEDHDGDDLGNGDKAGRTGRHQNRALPVPSVTQQQPATDAERRATPPAMPAPSEAQFRAAQSADASRAAALLDLPDGPSPRARVQRILIAAEVSPADIPGGPRQGGASNGGGGGAVPHVPLGMLRRLVMRLWVDIVGGDERGMPGHSVPLIDLIGEIERHLGLTLPA